MRDFIDIVEAKDVRPDTNSLGEPIAATPEAIANFWKWFAGSKIVDGAGRPLVVYHGSPHAANIEAFDMKKAGGTTGDPNAVLGVFFTTDRAEAMSYGSGNLIAAYLRLRNPIDMDMDELCGAGDDEDEYREIKANLIADGLDGIISDLDNGTGQWFVAFRSTQIKSLDNIGEFARNGALRT